MSAAGYVAAHGKLLGSVQGNQKIASVVGLNTQREELGKARRDFCDTFTAGKRSAALDDGSNGRHRALTNLRQKKRRQIVRLVMWVYVCAAPLGYRRQENCRA